MNTRTKILIVKTMSTIKFRCTQEPTQAVLDLIMGYMHRVAKPLYIGLISLEIGWSLERTQYMLEELERRGETRLATNEEKQQHGLRLDSNVWTLVQAAQPSKAKW